MNKKTFIVIVIIAALFVGCSLYLFTMNNVDKNATAVIYVNNNLYTTINLSEKKYIEYTIKTEYGYNKIVVDNGNIYVSESDCPDKTCIKTGKISGSGKPIICMPHRLEIVISTNKVDGFTG